MPEARNHNPFAKFDASVARLEAIFADPNALEEAVELLNREKLSLPWVEVKPIGVGPFAEAARRVAEDDAALVMGAENYETQADTFDRAAVAYFRNEAAGVRLHQPLEIAPAFPLISKAIGEAALWLQNLRQPQPALKVAPRASVTVEVFEEPQT